MSVPYIFNTVAGGATIPLSQLDANFAYILAQPEFTGNVKVDGTLTVQGQTSLNNGLQVTGTSVLYGALTLGVSGLYQGFLNLSGGTSGAVTLTSASNAGSWTMTLPASSGTSGYVLTTDGSGNTNWSNPTSFTTEMIVGTTPIGNGTSGQVFYDNGGILGQYAAVPVAYGGTGASKIGRAHV